VHPSRIHYGQWLVYVILSIAFHVVSAHALTISNVAVVVYTSSAVVTWTTDAPATTQVQLSGADGTGIFRYPRFPESTLITNHSQVIPNLDPGSLNNVIVFAQDSSGVAAASPIIPFTTASVDSSAALDFDFYFTGPLTVYAGSDLYISLHHALTAGSTFESYSFLSFAGLPTTIQPHLICVANNDASDDSKDFYQDIAGHINCPTYYPTTLANMRLRTSATTAPQTYTMTTVIESHGIQKTLSYSFTVLPAPAPTPKAVLTAIPAIPGLAKWEGLMTTLGANWCHQMDMLPVGWEGAVWYYDGGRVYQQIADYTHNPATWLPCAQSILSKYQTYVNDNTGNIPGWRKFPHGLAMDYWRTGNSKSKNAVLNLNSRMDNGLGGGSSDIWSERELAYAIDVMVTAEQITGTRNPWLTKAIDFAIGQVGQFTDDGLIFNQPFFDGVLVEALIQYYSVSHDPRIPPTVKKMLDFIWSYGYNPQTHAIVYNVMGSPNGEVQDLNDLVAMGYAWYWALTGDDVYRQRGDDFFVHSLDTDISFSGKIFSQTYRMTFDFVRYRSGQWISTTDPAANAQDITQPVISGLRSEVQTDDFAALTWTTDEQSDTQVEYGFTTDYGSLSVLADTGAGMLRQHSVNLGGLAADSTYHFRVRSRDSSGNLAVSSDQTFRTTSNSVRPPPWIDPSWRYRKQIALHHEQVAGHFPLKDFPVLISIIDSDVAGVETGNGSGIVFTDGNGQRVPFEIESYDARTGALIAWVKVPYLSPTIDSVICLYYGVPATVNAHDKEALWSDGYLGVWHLGMGDSLAKDSTAHALHGSMSTAPVLPAAGIIGSAGQFAGYRPPTYLNSPRFLQMGTGTLLQNTDSNQLTLEAWIKRASPNDGGTIINAGGGGVGGYSWSVGGTGAGAQTNRIYLFKSGAASIAPHGDVPTDTEWHSLVAVFNGSALTSYVDGRPQETMSVAANTFDPAASPLTIGSYDNANDFFGTLDEIKVSNVARSSDWILTEFNNQHSPATFVRPTDPETYDKFSQLDINWPATVRLDDTLKVPSERWSVARVEWEFVPVRFGASIAAAHTQSTAAGTVSFSTMGGAVTPAQQHLNPGEYQVTVTLIAINGVAQARGSRAVTLVASGHSAVKVYPNPWRSDKHATHPSITFDGLTIGTTIKLFTVSAREVKELHTDGPSIAWDLTNDSGDKVGSGIYLYLITDGQGDKVRGKVAVIK
jgi:hypothetical protein